MNCCEFGECKQGHGCPVRMTVITPTKPEETQPRAWIDELRFCVACVLTGAAIGFGCGLGRLLKLF